MRKLIANISVFLLATLGLFIIYWNIPAVTYLSLYSGVISGGVFIFWSILLGISQTKSYKGGAASIVGSMLLTVGIAYLIDICFFENQLNMMRITKGLAITSLFILAGIALLKQGHQFHLMLKASHPPTSNDKL